MGDAPLPSSGERGLLMALGRPIICTPELTAALCEQLRKGMYLEPSCALVGIHKSTVYDWLERAKAGEQPFRDFSDSLEKATAEAETRGLGIVQSGEAGWQGNAWFLERRYRDRWRRDKPDDTQTQHAPPIIQVQLPESDRIRKLEEALRKAGIEVPE